jgi:hypothetical protein
LLICILVQLRLKVFWERSIGWDRMPRRCDRWLRSRPFLPLGEITFAATPLADNPATWHWEFPMWSSRLSATALLESRAFMIKCWRRRL